MSADLSSQEVKNRPLRILGVEGGGTKTEWLLAEWRGGTLQELDRGLLSAGNMKLLEDAQLSALFAVLPQEIDRAGIFLAGCASEADRARLQRLASETWPGAILTLGSDRDSALATAFGEGDGIVVIAGTGCAVHGRKGARIEKAGGWGQLLGDRGGGYDLAMQALRGVLTRFDLNDREPVLARDILRRLSLNRLQDLVDWASHADKMSVARLTPAIFEAARSGDAEMRAIIRRGAELLAEYAAAVASRLEFPTAPVRLFGGIFAHYPEYAALFCDRLSGLLPGSEVELCLTSGSVGAALLAVGSSVPYRGIESEAAKDDRAELQTAATEQVNPRSTQLGSLDSTGIVELFIAEESCVQAALAACRESLAAGVDVIAASLSAGGRLFYLGAGTSGRLGVLDASEIPPTFGTSQELVQGIIAGGASALHRSIEGAEDEPEAGALSLRERGLRAGDVACGIAASGRTPFVLGALAYARQAGAATILLTCNPQRRKSAEPWGIEIDLPTGPELVTGSTRLKAGTATKVALNILSTGAMIRLGKVRGNAMVDVSISNAKLRDRGVRLVSQELSIPYEEAGRRLEAAGWSVRKCLADKTL